MDNNNLLSDLSNVLKFAESFAQKMESGEGLNNVPEDKKKEFYEEFQKRGVPDRLNELKSKLQDLKNVASIINGTDN